MKNPIKLNSQEWCDIIFNDKNKSYGAYKMRMTSSKRHSVAFLVTILFAIAVALIPTLVSKVSAVTRDQAKNIDVKIEISQLETEESVKEEVIETAIPEPPKLLLNSIQFVPPVIGLDSEVPDGQETPPMESIIDDNRIVGYQTIDTGTDDLNIGAELARREEENRIVEREAPPITIAEIMPQFPGGEAEMMGYIGKNLKYPVVDQENGTQGRVTVRFVVSKTGEIDQVEVVRGISPTADKEAMRVVKSMPRWIPGKQNGKPVAVYFTLPVVYRLK